MKGRNLLLLGGSALLLLLASVFAWKSNRDDGNGPDGESPPAAVREHQPARADRGADGPDVLRPRETDAAPAVGESGVKILNDEELDRVLLKIDEAATQYEASQIPVIAPYLTHGDRRVRQAAVDGLIVLGESAAATHLREAASRLEDVREAAMYLETADYLELPPLQIRRRR